MSLLLQPVARAGFTAIRARLTVSLPRITQPSTANTRLTQRTFATSFCFRAKRYTESHEWVEVGADGKTCTVGISKHAASALGDVVYVELPEVGDETTASEAFGTVESVKSASDIVAPVSGSVAAVNEGLGDRPADLGGDPEGEAWLVKIEAEDVSVVEGMMTEEAYGEFTKES